MTQASEKLKLEMVQAIGHLDDDSLITTLHKALQEILSEPNMPIDIQSFTFERDLKEGLTQLINRETGSWEAFDAAYDLGMEEGLAQRKLDGKPRD
jgi:hypothetical protein